MKTNTQKKRIHTVITYIYMYECRYTFNTACNTFVVVQCQNNIIVWSDRLLCCVEHVNISMCVCLFVYLCAILYFLCLLIMSHFCSEKLCYHYCYYLLLFLWSASFDFILFILLLYTYIFVVFAFFFNSFCMDHMYMYYINVFGSHCCLFVNVYRFLIVCFISGTDCILP